MSLIYMSRVILGARRALNMGLSAEVGQGNIRPRLPGTVIRERELAQESDGMNPLLPSSATELRQHKNESPVRIFQAEEKDNKGKGKQTLTHDSDSESDQESYNPFK